MERIGRRINRWFEAMGDPRQMSAESYGINQASLPLAPTLTRAVFADRSYQQSLNWLTTSGLTGAFWLTSQSPPEFKTIHWVIGLDGLNSRIGIDWQKQNEPSAVALVQNRLQVIDLQQIETFQIIEPQNIPAAVISVNFPQIQMKEFLLCLHLKDTDWQNDIAPFFNGLYLASGKNVRSGFLRDYLSGTRLSSVPFERAIQFNQFLHPEV